MKQGMGLDLLAVPEMHLEMEQLRDLSKRTDNTGLLLVNRVVRSIQEILEDGNDVLSEHLNQRPDVHYEQLVQAWGFGTIYEHGAKIYKAIVDNSGVQDFEALLQACVSQPPESVRPFLGSYEPDTEKVLAPDDSWKQLNAEQIRANLLAQFWKHMQQCMTSPNDRQHFQRKATKYDVLRRLQFRPLTIEDLPEIERIYNLNVIQNNEIEYFAKWMRNKHDRTLLREMSKVRQELNARGLFVEEWDVPYGNEPSVKEDFVRGLQEPLQPNGERFLGYCLSDPSSKKIYALMTMGMRGEHDTQDVYMNTMRAFVAKGSLGGNMAFSEKGPQMTFEHEEHAEMLSKPNVLKNIIRATYLAVDTQDPVRVFAAARLVAKTKAAVMDLLKREAPPETLLLFEVLYDLELGPYRKLTGLQNNAAIKLMTDFGAKRYGTHRNVITPTSKRQTNNHHYRLYPIYDVMGGSFQDMHDKAQANWKAVCAAFGNFDEDNN